MKKHIQTDRAAIEINYIRKSFYYFIDMNVNIGVCSKDFFHIRIWVDKTIIDVKKRISSKLVQSFIIIFVFVFIYYFKIK